MNRSDESPASSARKEAAPPREPPRSFQEGMAALRADKKMMIAPVLGAVMLLIGVALHLGSGGSAPAAKAQSPKAEAESVAPAGSSLRQGFAESTPAPETAPAGENASLPEPSKEPARTDPALAPFFVKGGFGMLIGFAIGYAIRLFMRLTLFVVGVYFLILTMMAYAGWVEIHWAEMFADFRSLFGGLSQQFASFRHFLNGSIPSAGLTALGFYIGARRR
ncbi:MAG: hypothetical protein J7M29_09420 [Verrucomicrobia bacterium]|nr:hypothetical protein [Verrucomicrobiota bacterium]